MLIKIYDIAAGVMYKTCYSADNSRAVFAKYKQG